MILRYAILGIRQVVLTVEVSCRHIYNLNGQTNNEHRNFNIEVKEWKNI
jgi:hypothetical protein